MRLANVLNNKDKMIEGFISGSNFSLDTNDNIRYCLNKVFDENASDIKAHILNVFKSINNYGVFMNYKHIFKDFCTFYNIDDFDLSSLEYEFKFVTFEMLQDKISNASSSEKLNRRHANRFLMARLVAYLLWVGIDTDEISELERRDFNIEDQVLTTKKRSYDLKSPLYSDCALELIHELEVNKLNSMFLIDEDTGFKEYSVRCKKSHIEYQNYTKQQNDVCDKIIRSNRPDGGLNMTDVLSTVSALIYSKPLIFKSGLFSKLNFLEQNNRISISTQNEFKEQMFKIGYSYGSIQRLYVEYKQYKGLFA